MRGDDDHDGDLGEHDKRCPRCRLVKDRRTDFYRDRARRDGLQLWCVTCCAETDKGRIRRPTARRTLRVRANNRALAALRDLHRAEFELLFAECLAAVTEQADRWAAEMPQNDDETPGHDHGPVTPLLRPGPAAPGEEPADRILPDGTPGSCRLCRNRHDKGHECPICGSRPGPARIPGEQAKPYVYGAARARQARRRTS